MEENQFSDLPLGLSMALAKNPKAMKKYGSMNEQEQMQLVEMAHNASSKSEMQRIVNQLQ